MLDDPVWPTRRASLRDRDALAALCRAAVGPDDYVLEILDDLILRQVVFVALDDDRIAGMGATRDTVDEAAWVSAARTHPAYRQKGVAVSLLRAFEGLARNKGRHAIRLWAESTNEAGIATAAAAGLGEVARFARVAGPAASRSVRPEPAGLTDAKWAELERSPVLAKGRAFVAYDGTFLRLTRGVAHRLANAGALVAWDGKAALLSGPDEGAREGILRVSPLLGPAEAVLMDAPRMARARGAAFVEVIGPHAPEFIRAAKAAGLAPGSWGREIVLCEKALSASTVVRRRRRTYGEINASKRTGYGALAPSSHAHGETGPHEDRWNP